MSKVCAGCGFAVATTAAFCGRCGRALTAGGPGIAGSGWEDGATAPWPTAPSTPAERALAAQSGNVWPGAAGVAQPETISSPPEAFPIAPEAFPGAAAVATSGVRVDAEATTAATIGQRLLARVIDAVIGAGLGVGIGATLYLFAVVPNWKVAIVLIGVLQAFLLAIALYNELYRVATTGRSWGRELCGIAVVDTQSGGPIGFWRMLARALVYALPIIGPLSPLFGGGPWYRGLPDLAAGSTVIVFSRGGS